MSSEQPVVPSESSDAQGGGAAATQAPPREKRQTKPGAPRVDQLPPYKVLLHNDDVSDMLHVVRSIVELTPLVKERALEVMLEAHNSGVALLLVTHKERAELYRDQFASKKLTVTIEPG